MVTQTRVNKVTTVFLYCLKMELKKIGMFRKIISIYHVFLQILQKKKRLTLDLFDKKNDIFQTDLKRTFLTLPVC